MTEIRYWHTGNENPGVRSTEQSKKAREAVEKFDKSFRSELLGQLSMLDGDALMSGSNNGLSSDLFGTGGPNLMDLDIDGIEKVWAAQMDSPLNSFGNINSNSGSDPGGLGGVVDLLVKEQIARARKQLEQQQQNYSLDEFVADVSGEETLPPVISGDAGSLDEFVTSIHQQIKDASSKYEIPASEIRKQLFNL